ncbi:MAG: nicotinate phosphoribosyltransferase [Coriobacteriales bacterium]|jgi:nicotinate phosphoribosyltransferase|nr:nicotinate phosphoribosyltransferase [Coriobacteriales bacterium]
MKTRNALFTDLYQLTMAQTYFDQGLHDAQADFYWHFRNNPFHGGYSVFCGSHDLARILADFRFDQTDIDYLAGLTDPTGAALFSKDFLNYLTKMELGLRIELPREGELVFPYEPLCKVEGPLLQAQLVETLILNTLNFETLIATKAARICAAAEGRPVAEFGLRRAQGQNGGDAASYAACVGGCASTSNLQAGAIYQLPVSGTHAHSLVMSFKDELTAFRAYVKSYPRGAILLVDTYDVASGIANAITVAHEMEKRGERLAGIRIDSGDLAWLSKQARQALDAAGLSYVKITVSNNLDEYTISSLLGEQGATIDSFGVGTKLATAFDEPALSGIYKLSRIRRPSEEWQPVLKLTAQLQKSTLPGDLDLLRYYDAAGEMIGDLVFDRSQTTTDQPQPAYIIDPFNELRQKDLSKGTGQRILMPLAQSAKEAPLDVARQLEHLGESNRRLLNPHSYPVGLDRKLHQTRDQLLHMHRPRP